MDHSRDPCPWVALSDFGGAFSMGAIGGSVWHGIKGFRNSPYGERRIGMITAIKARAPVTGGNFGVWGGMFSTYDCAVKGIRKKEDPYNSIIAGFLTGGSLAIRGGWRAARNGAIMCGIFLGVIEGVGIGIQRMMAENTRLDVSICAQSTLIYLTCYTASTAQLSTSRKRQTSDCLTRTGCHSAFYLKAFLSSRARTLIKRIKPLLFSTF